MEHTNSLVDYYRGFRLSLLTTERFRHLLLPLYWIGFGLAFYLVEQVFTPSRWHVMHCALDDVIPFCEWFVIPYVFWFVYMVGMHVYTFFFDVAAFKKLMTYIIITYSAALVLFLVFPTAQNLRPAAFPRDNVLCRFMGHFYQMDTSTNVCPSLHVVGSMAVLFAAWDTPRFQTRKWKIAFDVTTALICVSTVFLKQHSVVDVVVGLLFSYAGYLLVYRGGLERIAAVLSRQREHFKRICG